MRRLLLILLVMSVLAACAPQVPEPPSNLVVICIDTVRYDSFIVNAGEDALTPWLQRAQVYSDASSTAPWTMPGVASLLTGLYPVEHGAGRFPTVSANLDEQIPSALADDAETLAERLDAAYFRTGAFVAHPFFIDELGLRQGFQQVHNRRGWHRNLDRMWQWTDKISPPDRFFGYLHFMEAHHQHTQSNAEMREIVADFDDAKHAELKALYPDNCSDPDSRRCLQSVVYENAVRQLREAVASVLDGLEERGILDDTLVLVYSDHGEEFWDHEEIQLERGNDTRSHTGLGHGQSLYQELLGIPLITWHPGLPAGVHDEPVSLVDVVPSLLTWLGIETGDEVFSGELLPPLQHRWFGEPPARTLFASGIAYGTEQVAARVGLEKAIFHVVGDEFELYDLETDPGELNPLDDQGALYALGSLTGDYLEMPVRLAGAQGELDEEQLANLKAIGYLQGVEEDSTTPPDENTAEANTPEEAESDDEPGDQRP